MNVDTTAPTDYRWSTLSIETTAAWADLVNHLAVVDRTEEFLSADDLAEDLNGPGLDAEQDTLAVWHGDLMVGYGTVSVPPTLDHEGHARAYLGGGVHAEHRGLGLGTALMQKLETRGTALLAERHPGQPAHFAAGGGREGSSASELLADHGYAVVRYFDLLGRGLQDLPEVATIDGVEFCTPTPDDEQAVMLAHNEAFRDHWGSGPTDAERWHTHWSSRASRPSISTLAKGRGGGELDGEVLAYVLVGQWQDREGYVNILGTVPQARGKGIAAAALAHTLHRMADSGDYDLLELDVDSDSITGATRLYERLGFTHKLRSLAMRRQVSAAAG